MSLQHCSYVENFRHNANEADVEIDSDSRQDEALDPFHAFQQRETNHAASRLNAVDRWTLVRLLKNGSRACMCGAATKSRVRVGFYARFQL